MKTMIYTLAYAALLGTTLGSCNDDNAPVLTQKDWTTPPLISSRPMKTCSALTTNRNWATWATPCRSTTRKPVTSK